MESFALTTPKYMDQHTYHARPHDTVSLLNGQNASTVRNIQNGTHDVENTQWQYAKSVGKREVNANAKMRNGWK
eukprot:9598793-Karenia_brevis.AAC.1